MSVILRRRTAAVFLSVLATVALSGISAPASAAPSAPATDVSAAAIKRYVALGDSYTAGPLIPLPRLDPIGCLKSTSNYPAYLSWKLGLWSYTDASCSGAQTVHMTTPQSVPLGTNRPQLDRLTPDTDLVTLGIGGNDFGTFGKLVDTCPELRDTNPTGSPCRDHYTVDGVDTITANFPAIGDRIAAVINEIKRRSPQARILVVGYPRLLPPEGTCPDVIPFADGDYRWADSVEQGLNQAIREAAERTGAEYVDTYGPSLGHDACAGDEAWINGKNHNLLAAASYHPFASYMAAAASLIYDQLRGVPPDAERAAAAARAARAELQAALATRAVSAQDIPVQGRRAAAALGLVHGGTETAGICPVR